MAINVYALTDVSDTLGGSITTPFELTSYADDSTITLASGRAEEVGSAIYRVESGDTAVTDSGVANGTAYIYVDDNGDGTASATLSATAPTFDANKGGYYNGTAKAVFKCIKSTGPVYSNKVRLNDIRVNSLYGNSLYVDGTTSITLPFYLVELSAGDLSFIEREGNGTVTNIFVESDVYEIDDVPFSGTVRIKASLSAFFATTNFDIKIYKNTVLQDTQSKSGSTTYSYSYDMACSINDDIKISLTLSDSVNSDVVTLSDVSYNCDAQSTVMMNTDATYTSH